MNFIKNDYAQAQWLISAVIIVLIAAIIIWQWDPISHAISQFLKATCVNDPRWSWNNC